MKWYRNLKVGVKIISGFAIALLLMVIIGVISLTRLNEINQSFTDLTQNLYQDSKLANDMVQQIYRARLFANRYFLGGSTADLETAQADLEKLQTLLDTADQQITNTDRVALLSDIKEKYQLYTTGLDEVQQLIAEQDDIHTNTLEVQGPVMDQKLLDLQDEALLAGELEIVNQVGRTRSAASLMRLDAYKYIATHEEQWVTKFNERHDEVTEGLGILETLITDENDLATLSAVNVAMEIYKTGFDQLVLSYNAQHQIITDNLDVSGPAMRESASAITDSVAEDSDSEAELVENTVLQTQWIILGVMAAALLLGFSLGIVISRSITKPLAKVMSLSNQIANVDLKNLTNEISEMANGDLTRRVAITANPIQIDTKDEVGRMAAAFNEMIASLKKTGEAFGMMTETLRNSMMLVSSSAASVGAASQQLAGAANQAGQATSQIATTIQQVAKGTAQQSESINKTAMSVEQLSRAIDGVARGAQEQSSAAVKSSNITSQMSQAILQVAGNAQNVTVQASKAASSALKGSQTMEETTASMRSIKEKVGLSTEKVRVMGQRSEQIGVIVETIEDIASQTNLLALNAAIEAARAGEHGKGFAVVADEVRKLAERASSATKEIAGLVKGIQTTVNEAVTAMDSGAKEVDNGVQRVNQAGQVLTEILEAAQAVNQQAEQAAAAAQQMSASANELVTAVDSVSAIIEENTASTEEMAANSSEVNEAIENIASISEENSAAIEEVSASTEEMSAQVEEVNASAESLAEMALSLQEVVSRFKI